jgi:hypothetical protein
MDQHDERSEQVAASGRRPIEDLSHLNFEKVVARAERSELAFSPQFGALAHRVGICAGTKPRSSV